MIHDNINKICEIFLEFYKKLENAFNEKIFPALKETLLNLEQILTAVYEETIHLFVSASEKFFKILKTFENDFAKVFKTIATALRKVAAVFDKYVEFVRNEIKDIYKVISDYFKDFPGFEHVQELFKDVCIFILIDYIFVF